MMMKRTLETDLVLWIVFVVAAVLGVVLDRVAPQAMAAWGWVLILIALGAGLGALAWPLFGEKTQVEPSSDTVEAESAPEMTEVMGAQLIVIEPVAEVADPPPVEEETQPELAASEPDPSADNTMQA